MTFATNGKGGMRATGTAQGAAAAAQSVAAAPAWLEVFHQAPANSSASLGWRHLEAHRFDGLRCWNLNLPPVPKHFIATHLLRPSLHAA